MTCSIDVFGDKSKVVGKNGSVTDVIKLLLVSIVIGMSHFVMMS